MSFLNWTNSKIFLVFQKIDLRTFAQILLILATKYTKHGCLNRWWSSNIVNFYVFQDCWFNQSYRLLARLLLLILELAMEWTLKLRLICCFLQVDRQWLCSRRHRDSCWELEQKKGLTQLKVGVRTWAARVALLFSDWVAPLPDSLRWLHWACADIKTRFQST